MRASHSTLGRVVSDSAITAELQLHRPHLDFLHARKESKMAELLGLLHCVGNAVIKNASRSLSSLLPFGEIIFDIARDAWEMYRSDYGEPPTAREVLDIAQSPPERIKQLVTEAHCGEEPKRVQALAEYLAQMPATVRRALRRPSDPTGTTLPCHFALESPESLIALLPIGWPRFQPGDKPLAADWELVELLGKGSFGEVWKARHLHQSSRPPVALKFCLDGHSAKMLQNEAKLHDHLGRVQTSGFLPGFVPLLETFLRNDPPCLMYEYIEGGDLATLAQEWKHERKLNSISATQIISQLTQILAIAHAAKPALIHRDLKPSNILVRTNASDNLELFIADLGIGELVANQSTQEHVILQMQSKQRLPSMFQGAYTPLYASPQQMRGECACTRDDVHALGVIWFQLVVGDFSLTSIPSDWKEEAREAGLGADFLTLLGECLASKAERRLASASALYERMRSLSQINGPSIPETRSPICVSNVYIEVSPPQLPIPPEAQVPDRLPVPESRCKPPTGKHDISTDNSSYVVGGVVVGGVVVGYCLGVPIGWFVGGIVYAIALGFLGWIGGCGFGLFLSHRQKRKRISANNLARQAEALLKDQNWFQASLLLDRALRIDPTSKEALLGMASLLLQQTPLKSENHSLALKHTLKAVSLPGQLTPLSLRRLVIVGKLLRQSPKAAESLSQALNNTPQGAATLNPLVWILATANNPLLRDGLWARELALAACVLTHWHNAAILDTLAAAQAEIGLFDEAQQTQRKAITLAAPRKRGVYEVHLRLLQQHQPIRQRSGD
jgi:serine/threonine protein kinase